MKMAHDDVPDPARILKLAKQMLSSAERRHKYSRIDFMDALFWYPTQLAFFADGASGKHQRLIYGGNQSGKTLCCAAEVSWHMSGIYPPWWTGKRFSKPIRAWIIGESSVLIRDGIQKQLCGGRDMDFGTGTIPLDAFSGVRKTIMVAGGTGAIDTIYVNHIGPDGKIDGVSSATFKSFEMRRERMQSESIDLIWIDERPDEELYNELYARTSATDGHLIVSYTPIGPGAAAGVTARFLTEASPDRGVHRITGDEVKHISEERRAELSANLSDNERETRLEGIPQLGSGPIFPHDLLSTCVKEFNPDDLPSWTKRIVGIDFGFGHPFAAVLIAWDPQFGQIWVIDSFRLKQSSALYHVQRIHEMTRGLRVPISWPHDGHQHDKGSGLGLADQYKNFGANMLHSHAINHGTKENNVEVALAEIREHMYTGKLTIAKHNGELIEEMRMYHRSEDFKIVKNNEDLVSGFRYAVMMRRKGRTVAECDGVGYGPMQYAGKQRGGSGEVQIASDMDISIF
jgi:phage terminase large subunit-like protein